MPMVIISVPTVGWPRRAASFWAVTRAPMHSSDMRSKIIESLVDPDRLVLQVFAEILLLLLLLRARKLVCFTIADCESVGRDM